MSSLAEEGVALLQIFQVLDPLTPSERARVLLSVALKSAPSAFTHDEYLRLIDAGKEPSSRQLSIPLTRSRGQRR